MIRGSCEKRILWRVRTAARVRRNDEPVRCRERTTITTITRRCCGRLGRKERSRSSRNKRRPHTRVRACAVSPSTDLPFLFSTRLSRRSDSCSAFCSLFLRTLNCLSSFLSGKRRSRGEPKEQRDLRASREAKEEREAREFSFSLFISFFLSAFLPSFLRYPLSTRFAKRKTTKDPSRIGLEPVGGSTRSPAPLARIPLNGLSLASPFRNRSMELVSSPHIDFLVALLCFHSPSSPAVTNFSFLPYLLSLQSFDRSSNLFIITFYGDGGDLK